MPIIGFAADPVSLPMTVAATGKILVDITINGKPVSCIVDTGSPYFLLVDQVLVDQMGVQKSPVSARLRFFAEDSGGETYKVKLDSVKIGPFRYENVKAITIDNILRATGTGNMELPNFWAQGILGMAFLQHFRVVIDYPNNRFLLYPPDDSTTFPSPPFASFYIPTIGVSGSGGSVPFLIDTGSSFAVVSREAMDPLGMSYLSVSGSDPLFKGVAKGDEISIGGVAFRNPTMEAADHFAEYAGGAFVGILGYDYLQSLVLDMDFPARKIRVIKP